MNIEYLVQLLENKMIFLTNSRAQAFMVGDLATINSTEAEMVGITDTLYKLRLLLTATQAAAGANTDVSTMLSAGVEAIRNTPILLDNATACMAEYDISTYATDPLHEQKIADILGLMGAMNGSAEVDVYIDTEAISSPLTGQMILASAGQYAVDVRLMMAIMELDSRFGTAGVAVNTFNPGNVGNTGTETKTYGSWQEGVEAVAEWLSHHRAIVAPEPIVETIPVETAPVEIPPIEIPPVETIPVENPIINPEVMIPPTSTSTATSTPTIPETPMITPEVTIPPAPTSTPVILETPIVNSDTATVTTPTSTPITPEAVVIDSAAASTAEVSE